MIRVLLVHEARLLRSALAALLGREKDLEVTTACWKSAAASARSLRPDVCVADVDHPGAGSLIAAAELPQLTELSQLSGLSGGSRGPRLLVLATPSRPALLRRASQARALGYVNKDASPEVCSRRYGGSPKENASSTARWASTSSRPPRCPSPPAS